MVFQNSVPFCAPSQRRLHMIAGPEETAYVAVLNQFNEPQGGLHHMTAPIRALDEFVAAGQGSVVAEGAKGRITFSTGQHAQGFDVTVAYEDLDEHTSGDTEIERFEFDALVKSLREPAAN